MVSFVYNPYQGIEYPIYASYSDRTLIGHILTSEVFVTTGMGDYKKDCDSYAYTSAKGWTPCYVDTWPENEPGHPYDSSEAYQQLSTGHYKFKVRRQCRIFDGNGSIVTYLSSGDQVSSDGQGTAGVSHPDRLSVNGYWKDDHWTYNNGLWCDTDINIGYSTAPTVHGDNT
jgi:hypothetical protein